MLSYILIFLAALTFAILGTPLARRLAVRLGVVDVPNARKVHLAPRFFVNVPIPLAAALDLQAGEQVQWQLLGRSDLRLHRLAAPAAKPRPRKP